MGNKDILKKKEIRRVHFNLLYFYIIQLDRSTNYGKFKINFTFRRRKSSND